MALGVYPEISLADARQRRDEAKRQIANNIDPSEQKKLEKIERKSAVNNIQVYYLPARRDPADYITYGTNALLGRLLRAVRWDAERNTIKELTDQISGSLAANPSVNAFSETNGKL